MNNMANKKALLNTFGVEEGDDQMGAMGGMGEPGGWAGPAASGAPAVQPPKVEMPGALPSTPIMEDLPGAPPMSPEGPAATDYTKLGQFKGQMGPWNEGNEKFARPWDDRSERYKMLTVMSNFDPTKGVTPELVDALNKANIKGAKFSGSGDKLSATGLQGWNDYNGMEGIGDVVQGFKTGKGTWTPWSPVAAEGQSAAAQGGGGADLGGGHFGGAQLDEALSGDPLAKIQQLISQMSGSRPNFAALMQQLGGQ